MTGPAPFGAAVRTPGLRDRVPSWITLRCDAWDVHRSVGSDLRVHLLLAGTSVLVLTLALHQVIGYRALARPQPTALLWPMWWADGLPWRPVAITLTSVLLVVSVIGLVGYRFRWARVLQALTLVVFVAALSSFGKVNHGLHHLLIPVVVLAAVPTLQPTHDQLGVPLRAYDLVLVAQTVLLLTYTMSGFAKVWTGVSQLLASQGGLFSDRSLAALVANRALQTGESPPLAELIVRFPTTSAVAFAAAAVLELVAIATVARPRVAALWAILLAVFHIAVFWSMHINFSMSVAVLLLLFCLSPLLVSRTGSR